MKIKIDWSLWQGLWMEPVCLWGLFMCVGVRGDVIRGWVKVGTHRTGQPGSRYLSMVAVASCSLFLLFFSAMPRKALVGRVIVLTALEDWGQGNSGVRNLRVSGWGGTSEGVSKRGIHQRGAGWGVSPE